MIGKRDTRKQDARIKLALGMAAGLAIGMGLFVATLHAPAPTAAQDGTAADVTVLTGLSDQRGHVFDARVLQGRYALVYFGFTYCPDACPTALYQATVALLQLDPGAHRIQPIFVTVDPKRDIPAQLNTYLASFSPDWLGLTGAAEPIDKVEQQLGVIAVEHRDSSLPGGYTMDHSSEFLLFSPNGVLLKRLPVNLPADQLLPQLRELTRAQVI